jgi:hypothetical protein
MMGLAIFWAALTAVLHGCLEILATLLGVALAVSFVCALIVFLVSGIVSAFSSDATPA